MQQRILVFLIFLFLTACKTTSSLTEQTTANRSLPFPGYKNLSDQEKAMADSLIAYALDHEALYSLMGDLKPMSNLGVPLSFPLGKDSTQIDGQHQIVDLQHNSVKQALTELQTWNRVLSALSFGDYQFLLIPFRNIYDGERKLQFLVCRRDLLDRLLKEQAPFFAQWGFVPGTDPAIILTAIEFEERHDRYRAYGYLFGYPRHAVDFFVEASQSEQETGKFVKRSFFQIPVYAKSTGHFVYALPENFQASSIDSAKYYSAKPILDNYKSLRPKYVDKNGQFYPIRLYQRWW